jgi:hypothetical protein
MGFGFSLVCAGRIMTGNVGAVNLTVQSVGTLIIT